MACVSCGDKPKKCNKDFTKAVIEIDNPEQITLLRKVVIPASMGTEEQVPAAIGKYRNVILYYEANRHTYLYSSDGIPTILETEVPQEILDRIQDLEDEDREIKNRLTAVEEIASTALQPDSIDKVVMTDISLDANASTTTVQLDAAKENLLTGAQTTKNLPLPVASHDTAGVMNSPTFDAVSNNTSSISALMNGAVAITGLPASPTQSELTTAWENETGLSSLMNRASIYDVINDKVWTYYSNDNTWHPATNTTQVTINTFTNSSEGTIKGSTNVGQVFAESDGTGSVNGWDILSGNVSANTNNISSLQTGKQDKLTAGANITISAQNVISAVGGGVEYVAGDGINIESNIISADIYPADFFIAEDLASGKDAYLTFQKTIKAPFRSLSFYGDTFQQTYTGKNLLDSLNGYTHGYINNQGEIIYDATTNALFDYIEVSSSTEYTFSQHIPTIIQNVGIAYFDSTKTYISRQQVSNVTSTTFATPSNCKFVRLWVYRSSGFSQSILEQAELQFELGGIASGYEPFVGGAPAPSPSYPMPINIVTNEHTVIISGKNLLDSLNGFTKAYIDDEGTVVYDLEDPATNALFGYIDVASSKTYTFSCDTSISIHHIGIAYFDAGKIFISRQQVINPVDPHFTTPNNCKFVRIWVYRTSGIDQSVLEQAKLQFESGADKTIYESYQGKETYTIDLGSTELCKIGDYQDYIYKNDGDWYLHKECGKAILDGSESWIKNSGVTGSDVYGFETTNAFNDMLLSNTDFLGYLSDLFTATSVLQWNANAEGITQMNDKKLLVRIKKDRLNGDAANDFETWLGNHSVEVYYVLESATDTKITNTTLIEELENLYSVKSHDSATNILVTTTGTYLPIILDIVVFRKSLAGILALLDIFTNNEWNALWA